MKKIIVLVLGLVFYSNTSFAQIDHLKNILQQKVNQVADAQIEHVVNNKLNDLFDINKSTINKVVLYSIYFEDSNTMDLYILLKKDPMCKNSHCFNFLFNPNDFTQNQDDAYFMFSCKDLSDEELTTLNIHVEQLGSTYDEQEVERNDNNARNAFNNFLIFLAKESQCQLFEW